MSGADVTKSDGTFESVHELLNINFDGSEPLYAQITRQLQALIAEGQLSEGATLPSERRLAELLGVSRITAQNSYNELRQLGFISSHGRRGSIVTSPRDRITSPMNRLRGFTEEMLALGRKPSSRIVSRGIKRDRHIATIFGLPASAQLLYLQRIRYADGVPLSHEKAWYNLAAVPQLSEADTAASMYEQLSVYGHPLASCDQVIEVVMPSEEDRSILEIDKMTPCMLIKRHSYGRDRALLEYVEGTFRGDVYSYQMTLPV